MADIDIQTYDDLIAFAQSILDGRVVSQRDARTVLRGLARHREFLRMVEVAEVFLVIFPDDSTIAKAYGQALIEIGRPVAARNTLEATIGKLSELDLEYDDIHGVLGRAHKEIFLLAHAEGHPSQASIALTRAYSAYRTAFDRDPVGNFYHGINLAALLHLADTRRADRRLDGDMRAIAQQILDNIDGFGTVDVWAQATRVEARVALEEWDAAQRELAAYLHRDDVDAFQLHSTLRQLRDIWEIGRQGQMGLDMLRMLEAAALERSRSTGGTDSHTLRARTEAVQHAGEEEAEAYDAHLQKMFGSDGLQTYKWYRQGLERALAVACVLDESGSRRGTAFAFEPQDLGLPPAAVGEVTLMTNHHVMNQRGHGVEALMPNEARVCFEAQSELTFEVGEILFEDQATRDGLDVTIFTIKADLPDLRLVEFNLHSLPRPDEKKRVYVIGYPLGGELQFSLQDNRLLDHEGAPDGTPPVKSRVRVHYFAPTEPGNSGSPVFNDGWKCIALHHAGRRREVPKSSGLKKLNGDPGRYSANEGIWIGSIIAKIESDKKNIA